MGSSDFCAGHHRSWRCLPAGNTSAALPRCLVWRLYVLRPIPRRGCPGASVLSPGPRWSSPLSGRLDPRIKAFEACSGFTRVAARTLADLPTCRPLSLELRRIGRPLRLPGSYPGIPTIPGVGLLPTVTQHLSAAHLINAILRPLALTKNLINSTRVCAPCKQVQTVR